MFYKNYPGYRFRSSLDINFPKKLPLFYNPLHFRHFLFGVGLFGTYSIAKSIYLKIYKLDFWEKIYIDKKNKKENFEYFILITNTPSLNPLSQFSQF